MLGNKAVTFACNAIYNCWLSDTMTCHKAMSTELFRSLPLREEGFAIEAEITARLLRKGVRIYEVPISYAARSREEGKKLTPRRRLQGAADVRALPGAVAPAAPRRLRRSRRTLITVARPSAPAAASRPPTGIA